MSQKVRILITGSPSENDLILKEVDEINKLQENYEAYRSRILQRMDTLQMYLGLGIISVSTMNSIIYTMNNIKRIQEGRGNIDDVINITINTLIIVNRVNQLMKMMNNLQMAATTLSAYSRMKVFHSKFARFKRR